MDSQQQQWQVLACNVYVSEGHNEASLQKMEECVRATQGVHLAHKFVDAPYNRTGFTLTALSPEHLIAGTLALSHQALALIDLRTHAAKHPRLGALDHISVHCLGINRNLTSAPQQEVQPSSETTSSRQEEREQRAEASASQQQGSGSRVVEQHSSGQQQRQVKRGPHSVTAAAASWPLQRSAQSIAQRASHPIHPLNPPIAPNQVHDGQAGQVPPPHTQTQQTALDALAGFVARAVGSALAGPPAHLPVFYYGSAHPQHRRLAEIRRGLGYFKGSQAGTSVAQPSSTAVSSSSPPSGTDHHNTAAHKPHPPSEAHTSTSSSTTTATASTACISTPAWCGSLPMRDLSHFPPDEGPTTINTQHGVATIGAGPWVVNYNIPVYAQPDGSGNSAPGASAAALLQHAKSLARGVSERGGGLRLVESMALSHADGEVEVACNLLGGQEGVAPDAVQAYVEDLAAKLSSQHPGLLLVVGRGYQTGKVPEQLVHETIGALRSNGHTDGTNIA